MIGLGNVEIIINSFTRGSSFPDLADYQQKMTTIYKNMLLLAGFFPLCIRTLTAQTGFRKDYEFLHSTNLTADKTFTGSPSSTKPRL
jgi:hypothetical protein